MPYVVAELWIQTDPRKTATTLLMPVAVVYIQAKLKTKYLSVTAAISQSPNHPSGNTKPADLRY